MLKYSQLTLDCNVCPKNVTCPFKNLQYDRDKIPHCPILTKEWLNPNSIIIAAKPVTRELTKEWLAAQKN